MPRERPDGPLMRKKSVRFKEQTAWGTLRDVVLVEGRKCKTRGYLASLLRTRQYLVVMAALTTYSLCGE